MSGDGSIAKRSGDDDDDDRDGKRVIVRMILRVDQCRSIEHEAVRDVEVKNVGCWKQVIDRDRRVFDREGNECDGDD